MTLLDDFWVAFTGALVESAPLVVLGFVAAGLLHEFVPERVLRRRVGGGGLRPILWAVGVGSLLPVCSCSTIPLGIGLRRSGASTGAALAFMTSSPAISPVSVLLGWGLLGPVLLGWYCTVAISGAVAIGVVGNLWLRSSAETGAAPKPCGCGCGASAPSGASRLRRALRWSFGELGTEVSSSLLVGLAVAAVVMAFLPEGWVEGWLGQPSLLALLAAIAVSLPAYTCSVPAMAIAAGLIAKGVDPGVAVAFLVAGPATNLGELNAIRTAMGARTALFYAAMLVTVALAAGATTSLVTASPSTELAAAAAHGHAHPLDVAVLGEAADASHGGAAWWRWIPALVVMALALGSLPRWRVASGLGSVFRRAVEPAPNL